jgi:dihydroflavonol-4-reductase
MSYHITSSVHAIPDRPQTETMVEVDHFDPDRVDGQYAKSKAAAAQLALDYAARGLNVSVVHPSGIIGPGDRRQNNYMIRTIHLMAEGKIPLSVPGGYDFVDVRDVAEGIVQCAEKGRSGQCYILSGHYATVRQLMDEVCALVGRRAPRGAVSLGLARWIAPAAEWFAGITGNHRPVFTPYSVATLQTNAHFSHAKATAEFAYSPRPLTDTLRDTLAEAAQQ